LVTHFRADLDGDLGAAVLKLHGELDVASCAALQDELEGLSTNELVVVDLSDLEFIDSSGIGILVKANQQAAKQGRRFALVKGAGQVAELLALTGLADQLTVADRLADLLGG
jgi:anti-anti-sigma factor